MIKETIDTPSWAQTMHKLATAFMQGTREGKRDACDELIKIGQQLDAAKKETEQCTT